MSTGAGVNAERRRSARRMCRPSERRIALPTFRSYGTRFVIAKAPLSSETHAHTGLGHECDIHRMVAAVANKPLAITPPARNGTIRHLGGDNSGMKVKVIP